MSIRLFGGFDPEAIQFDFVSDPLPDQSLGKGISRRDLVALDLWVRLGLDNAGELAEADACQPLQALLHEGRLKIQKELSEAETLVRELQDFRVEFTAAGHLTFNARAGKHDDLVLALAIAIWGAYGGGMASWGDFELTRQRAAALGVRSAIGPRYFVGVDLEAYASALAGYTNET